VSDEKSGEGALRGLRIGLLQARHGDEFAALIARHGAEPVQAPCMREVRNVDDPELRRELVALAADPAGVFVFQTGVGSLALFDAAAEAGVGERFLAGLAPGLVVARGPKPLAVLLRHGVRVDRRTVEPHTTRQVTELLDGEVLDGVRVALQHHGAPNRPLVDYLRGRGADVVELFGYRWALPEDVRPVHRLLEQLSEGHLSVTAFTSASQVENLFAIAAERRGVARMVDDLNARTLVAAIGPTCAEALRERGVRVAITSERPKMVPFVKAIGEHFQHRSLP
jgi:uroporphyrinogen-III synthase